MKKTENHRVFRKIPEIDIHEYFNSDGTLKKGFTDVRSAYHCRDDKKNICYDRLALLKCSQALGHNRACL